MHFKHQSCTNTLTQHMHQVYQATAQQKKTYMTCLSLINHLSTPFKNSELTQSKILTTTTRSPGASCCQCFSNDNKTRDLALRPLEYCASQCKHQEVMEIQPPGFFMSKPKQDLDKKEDMLKKEKGNHDNETSEACFWGGISNIISGLQV